MQHAAASPKTATPPAASAWLRAFNGMFASSQLAPLARNPSRTAELQKFVTNFAAMANRVKEPNKGSPEGDAPPPLCSAMGASREVSGLGFFSGSHGFVSMDGGPSPEPEQEAHHCAAGESGSAPAPAPSWLHAPAASIASLHRPGGSVMDFLASAGSREGDNGGDASLRTAVEGPEGTDVVVDTLSGVMGSFNMTDSITGSVEGFLRTVKQENLNGAQPPASSETAPHAVMPADRPADASQRGARVEATAEAAWGAGASRVPEHAAGVGKEAWMHELAAPVAQGGWSHMASARAPAHDAGLPFRPFQPLVAAHPSVSPCPYARSPRSLISS